MALIRKGFTLIELLVVIAIIAILAAILFPVFAQAREKARAISCLSNCKQIAISQLQYIQDYDEQIPFWRNTPSTAPLDQQIAACWTTTMQPYLKNNGVFIDPSYSQAGRVTAMESPDCDGPGSSVGWFPPAQMLAHYAMAFTTSPGQGSCTDADAYWRYAGSSWQGNTPLTTSLSAVVRPAETANVCDSWTLVRNDVPRISTGFGCEAALSHHEGGNFVFLDGHAKWLKGNAERYHSKDKSGCVFETYFSYDKDR
jgi:prepilin-type N-terminal cleavage/methylation domain-containing protein/prepilin-type processing-associated H-X9-DG protein